ncbi:MAG: ABC transporter ATP-binding protein [Methylobacteriaceae bacterium]|nr:ABC transporter ATP-binding protein [Methylobacteriaceae bacterium]
MSAAPILQVRNLRAAFRTHHFGVRRDVPAVDDISFDVRANEIYGLAGESSSGKTTLIKTIAGVIKPPLELVGGSARFAFLPDCESLAQASPAAVAAIRWSKLAYIMQGSMNVLNPVRRIGKTFEDFALRHIGSAGDFQQRVEAHLQRVRLEPSVLRSYPHELSGGMRQRVTIALATICAPDFIIADEPTTALDVIVQKDVLAMMRDIQGAMGASILFVTHDMGVHAALTDRLGIMYAGRLVEEAPTDVIFRGALHPYTRHLIASLPRIGDRSERKSLTGVPPNLANAPPGCRFHPRCPLAVDICRVQAPAMTELATQHRVACHVVTGEAA